MFVFLLKIKSVLIKDAELRGTTLIPMEIPWTPRILNAEYGLPFRALLRGSSLSVPHRLSPAAGSLDRIGHRPCPLHCIYHYVISLTVTECQSKQ